MGGGGDWILVAEHGPVAFGIKGRMADQHLVGHNAQGIDVTADVGLSPLAISGER